MSELTPEQMAARIAELEGENTSLKTEKTKLQGKNSELIDREKEQRERADNAETNSGTELEKAQRRITKLEKERDDAVSRADKSDKGLRDYKASAALSNAIASANVDADDVEMITMALRSMVEDDADGDPSIKGRSIEEYTKSYFAGAGKKYVRVADHNGGGASGSGNSAASSWSKAPESGDELHRWMKWSAENKDEANALADTWKRADLRS